MAEARRRSLKSREMPGAVLNPVFLLIHFPSPALSWTTKNELRRAFERVCRDNSCQLYPIRPVAERVHLKKGSEMLWVETATRKSIARLDSR